MNRNAHYTLAKGRMFQELGPNDDTVILDVESGQLFTCNNTTADLLRHFEGGSSFSEAIDKLAEKYDVSIVTLEQDIGRIIEELLMENILVCSEEN